MDFHRSRHALGNKPGIWGGTLKLGSAVDAVIDFLHSGTDELDKLQVSGNLPFSDPRFSSFLETVPAATYKHSAMPLLELRFQVPVAVQLHFREGPRRTVILALRLYHDALWLSGSSASGKFDQIKYPELEGISLAAATQQEKQQNDVDNFLDGLGFP